jgi:hypothetical protein
LACCEWAAMEAEQDLVEWSFSAASISRLDAALVWR